MEKLFKLKVPVPKKPLFSATVEEAKKYIRVTEDLKDFIIFRRICNMQENFFIQ